MHSYRIAGGQVASTHTRGFTAYQNGTASRLYCTVSYSIYVRLSLFSGLHHIHLGRLYDYLRRWQGQMGGKTVFDWAHIGFAGFPGYVLRHGWLCEFCVIAMGTCMLFYAACIYLLFMLPCERTKKGG